MPVQVAMWVIDGVSYVGTGKSVPDHGLSLATGQDCAVWRVIPEGEVCQVDRPDVLLAEAGELRAPPVESGAVAPLAQTFDRTGEGEPVATAEPTKAEVPPAASAALSVSASLGPERPDPVAFSGEVMAARRDVNMRDRPSLASSVIRPVLREERVLRLDEIDGWVRIRLEDEGDEGWIDGRYLTHIG